MDGNGMVGVEPGAERTAYAWTLGDQLHLKTDYGSSSSSSSACKSAHLDEMLSNSRRIPQAPAQSIR